MLNTAKDLNEADNDESIATMIAGVAWKSLTMPACLPITTDYLPNEDKREENFKLVTRYSLLLEKIRLKHEFVDRTNKGIKMKNILPELVGHRIALGFQLVQLKADKKSVNEDKNIIRYKLCSSHTYHEILFQDDKETVQVEIWVAKKRLEKVLKEYNYSYHFQVPDSNLYNRSYCEFLRKNQKSIDWEAIDHYICIQGNGSISPLELQNCWRQRLYVMPLMYLENSLAAFSLTQTVNNVSQFSTRFDVYQRKKVDELKVYRECNFLRFMEFLNKVTRADDKQITSSPNNINETKRLPSPKLTLTDLLGQYIDINNNEDEKQAKKEPQTKSYVRLIFENTL